MPSHQILTDIYNSQEVADVVLRLRPEHLQQDILQHTFLELFEKPDDFILDLHQRGKLKAYIVKILSNTATYHRTPFSKQWGELEDSTDFNGVVFTTGATSESEFGEYTTLDAACMKSKYEVIRYKDDHKERVEIETSIACAVCEAHWYKAEMLRLYADLGSYKAVSEKTGIPLTSVFMTIKEVRKEIKSKL